VNQGRSQFEGSGKADLHWRSNKRTSLHNLKCLEQLRKRIKVLVKLQDKLVKVTIKAVRNACRRAGWADIARVDAWSHGGFYTRIIRDSMDGYLSLHQHLLGLATSDAPWKYTQVEIEHHVEEWKSFVTHNIPVCRHSVIYMRTLVMDRTRIGIPTLCSTRETWSYTQRCRMEDLKPPLVTTEEESMSVRNVKPVLHKGSLVSLGLRIWGTFGSTKDCDSILIEHGGHGEFEKTSQVFSTASSHEKSSYACRGTEKGVGRWLQGSKTVPV
jgi:hypothetical protein